MTFEATASGLLDKGRLTLGSAAGAFAVLDDLDEPHPPALPGRFLDIYTEHDQTDAGWTAQLRAKTRYRSEFGPALGPSDRTFEFVVETDQGGPVGLVWDVTANLDLAQHFLRLRDLESGDVVDMWAEAAYSFQPAGSKRRFRVEMIAGRSAPPLAFGQTVSVAEDGSVGLTLRAEDPEADPLTYEIVSAPQHGVVSGSGPDVTYVPAADYFGPDSFTFRARDAQGPSNVAVVSLVITPVNDAPSALPQTVVTNEDEAASITLAATDPDGDALTYTVLQTPSHGTLEGIPPSLTYRPTANYGGGDSFVFAVTDGLLQSAPALVAITVAPVNDPPRPAFTVPGEAANVAQWDNNLGSSYEGASVTASSQAASAPAANAIDDNPNTRWTSSGGPVSGQTLTLALPRGALHRVGRVRLVNAAGATEAIKRFDVRTSATTADPSAFTPVLSDLALSDGRIQEFAFPAPVEARFVQLRAVDNYGSASAVSVASFEVIGEGLGGVPSYFSLPGNAAAAADGGGIVSATSQSASEVASRAIDGNAATLWTTASGQRSNQVLVVELAREKTYSIDRVRIVNGSAPPGQGVKNFVVSVSATTPDPAAFTDVLSSIALNNATLQEFVFPGGPVAARYVRLTALDNQGSSCCISLGELHVVPVQAGSGSVSSGNAASERAENAIDASPTTGWRTAVGQAANQSLTLRLQAGRDHLVDRIRLASIGGGAASPRDFDVLVSATSDGEAAFVPVLSATLANNSQLQEFLLPGGPVRARYVKLLARNNYGGSSVFVSAFQAITVQTEGSVVSIPAPAGQLARNESPAQAANGALVLAFSSVFSGATAPGQMLDYVQDNPWATNGLAGQFALIRLSKRSLLNGVRVSPRLDCCPTQSVKDFEIWTSDTTTADEAFTKALAGTVQNNGAVQTFTFAAPIMARYVKYAPLTGYGDPQFIATSRFDVLAEGAGGVAGVSSAPLANPPELALDGNPATIWRTTTSSLTNQWLTVRLSGDRIQKVFGVRVSPEPNTGPRGFEIRVSTTTPEDAGFVTVASGALTSGDTAQEFGFSPVDARYVQFRWLSGYGTSFIGVRDVEVLGGVAAGALVRGVSSQAAPSTGATQILDTDTVSGVWTTASGQAVDQWLTLTLPGDNPIAVDRVALQGPGSTAAPREFEIQASTTSADPGAFTTIFAGTLRNDGALQNYFFDAVAARHLRLLIRTNYGAASVTVQNFRVFSPEFGEVQARFSEQSTAIDGRLTGRTWEFGDGGLAAEQDPAHTYPSSGVYSVRLTAAADTGLTGELVRPYRAAARPAPVFEFYPVNPREGQSVVFSDGTDDPSNLVLREWDFGDGVKTATSAASINHTFADNGTFTVSLRVTNAFGLVASTTRQVLVTNVAPTVTAGANRRWVAGDSIAFAPTITDPGTDPPSCSWDFGDGATSSACNATHTYLTPSQPTDAPVVFTAVLTVNDGDGGIASSAVDTNVFPQRMSILSAGLTNPIGIDWSPDLHRFVVANRYPNDQLVTVLPDGTVSTPLVPILGFDEVNLVVSPGLGGFARGDVHYNYGRNRQLGRVKMGPAGNVTQVDSPWVTQLNAATYGGITFDTQGGFGYDLLVVWQHGVIYRVNAAGQSTEIARLSGGEFEGATVAGPNFGPASGCLLTVVRLPAKVWAVCPSGPPFIVADMSGLTQNQTSWIRYVPGPGSLVFTDYELGRVLRGDPRVFGAAVVGHAVISTEYTGEVWDLYYDPATATFKTRFLALAPNAATARLEDIAFVPAHAQLAPSTAVVGTGSPHSLTATVMDEAGFGMAGLPITFTVSGANPRAVEVLTDASGIARFEYVGVNAGQDTISASAAGLTMNTVSVTWAGNAAPTANPQAVTTPEGIPAAVLLSGTDPEGESLTFAIVATPSHGTLSGAAPNLTYVPAVNYNGPDSFTFTVTDASGAASAPALVEITVTPVNDPPSANAQSISTNEDVPAPITLAGTDPENEALTFAVVTPPSRGTLAGAAPTLTYTPSANYNGPDSFTFTATDASGAASAPALVEITVTPVNDPPSANAQSISTTEDVAAPITLTGTDPENEALTFAIVTPPSHGTLSGTAPNLTYAPAANYNGSDSFTFTATDASGVTSPAALVEITVTPVNDPPSANAQSISTNEDVPAPITLAGTDPENDPLIFTIMTAPQHGTLAGTPPNLTYAPATNYNGPDSFTFTVTDASGATSAPAAVEITVTPVNDPPSANAQSISTTEDVAAPITLTGTDPENEALTFAIVTPPSHGTLSGTAPNLTYAPAANYNGSDSFTFTATDASGVTSPAALVEITVTPVNDPPSANAQSISTNEDASAPITLTGTDPENDPLTFTIVTPPQHGTLTGAAPNLTYTPSAGYSGPDSLTFRVTDAHGATSSIATVSILVQPATTQNRPPVCSSATGPRVLWPPNHMMTPISILGVTDPEGGAVTIDLTSIRQDEPLDVNGDGHTLADATLSPPAIRAERRQNGNGRVYTIGFKAIDPLGASCSGAVKVCVPKSQSGKGSTCVDDGPVVDSTGGVQ